MIQYTFVKKVDHYILINGNATPMAYTLFKKSGEIVHTNTLPANSSSTIDFKEDGHYYIELEVESETAIIPEFYVFYNLLRSFIEDIRILFCDCSDCNDAGCNEALGAMAKAISYNEFMYHIYRDKFQALTQTMLEDLEAAMTKCNNMEIVHGKVSYNSVFNQYLINYYLAFFYTDIDNATSDTEKEEIKAFYKWTTTMPCLKKHGQVPGTGSVAVPPTEETPTSLYWYSIFDNTFNEIFQ